jgi:hypothetical protein
VRKISAVFLVLCCILDVGGIQAATIEQLKAHFSPEASFQVKEDANNYYILASSLFKDSYAHRNLAVLSRATLYKNLTQHDAHLTGLEIKGFSENYSYEEKNRLFALSIVAKKDIIRLYDKNITDNNTALVLTEIHKLEDLKSKNKDVHEQLKELYFLIGDLDNYEKQTDILMDIIFNEN